VKLRCTSEKWISLPQLNHRSFGITFLISCIINLLDNLTCRSTKTLSPSGTDSDLVFDIVDRGGNSEPLAKQTTSNVVAFTWYCERFPGSLQVGSCVGTSVDSNLAMSGLPSPYQQHHKREDINGRPKEQFVKRSRTPEHAQILVFLKRRRTSRCHSKVQPLLSNSCRYYVFRSSSEDPTPFPYPDPEA
jgi:hypothetical protein